MDVCKIENVANNRTDMEKEVYVVTIGEVVDWDKEYHQPRVFSKEEDAIRYVKESYEEIKDEFDEDRYIFEYDEGDWFACIYDDGRWTSDHWEISTAKCEVIL
jgi:AAA+ ATPase superfamily predicted ATPase